jgi:cation transporter-like permease
MSVVKFEVPGVPPSRRRASGLELEEILDKRSLRKMRERVFNTLWVLFLIMILFLFAATVLYFTGVTAPLIIMLSTSIGTVMALPIGMFHFVVRRLYPKQE